MQPFAEMTGLQRIDSAYLPIKLIGVLSNSGIKTPANSIFQQLYNHTGITFVAHVGQLVY